MHFAGAWGRREKKKEGGRRKKQGKAGQQVFRHSMRHASIFLPMRHETVHETCGTGTRDRQEGMHRHAAENPRQEKWAGQNSGHGGMVGSRQDFLVVFVDSAACMPAGTLHLHAVQSSHLSYLPACFSLCLPCLLSPP